MADSGILSRIDAWAEDGLIDEATAVRLRAAEAARATDAPSAQPIAPPAPPSWSAPTAPGGGPGAGRRSMGGSSLGVSIAEMFGYLGAAFLLGSWNAFVLTGMQDADRQAREIADLLIPAIVLTLVGLLLMRGTPRMGRAAGVAFAVATIHVGGTAYLLIDAVIPHLAFEVLAVASSLAAAAAAVAFRATHPSVLTQVSLVGALWITAEALVVYAQRILIPAPDYTYAEVIRAQPLVPLAVLAVATAAWWLIVGVGLGALGRLESRRAAAAADPAASRAARLRAGATQLGAGLAAVTGVASAAWLEDYQGIDGNVRAIVPWVGDGALLALSVGLVGLGLRGSGAYLYPAALGVLVGLSDLNARYVAPGAGFGPALLFEGAILLGVGVAVDRLRRRVAVPAARTDADADPGSAVSPD